MSFEHADDDTFLTKGEVAQLCRVDVRTIDRWRMAGKIACHRTPGGGVLFRKRDVLDAVIAAQTPETPPHDRDR